MTDKLTNLRNSYPEINKINWAQLIYADPEILRSIIGEVGKKTGSKKNSDHDLAAKLSHTDYSECSFLDTFLFLWGDRTIMEMVHKTGMSKEIIYRMKKGEREPSFQDMEKIARAFNKEPAYFLEYRIGKILASIDLYLRKSPEVAASWYSKVKNAEGIKLK